MSHGGPLDGLRVVELASEHAAYAGKLLAEMGADVVLVEPPGGHPTRGYEPFVDDQAGPERSLWWWHYQTSKRGVVLDLDQAEDAALFTRLVRSADIVVEAESPGRLRRLGLDYEDLVSEAPGVVWASVTPFGRADPRSSEPVTDLTLLAGGGPVWSCGYDDHSLPPVRGGGNQAFHVGSVWAVTAIEAALIERGRSGAGQHVDVSLHAAANVTTEAASYSWLVAGLTVQRQTGRHATAGKPTGQTQRLGADGRYVSTGVPPQRQPQFVALLGWLEEHGLLQDFPERVFLEIGAERGIHASEVGDDVVATEILGAGREALMLLASQLPAYEFLHRGPRAGHPLWDRLRPGGDPGRPPLRRPGRGHAGGARRPRSDRHPAGRPPRLRRHRAHGPASGAPPR